MDSLLAVFQPTNEQMVGVDAVVENNPSACITIPSWWVNKPQSHIEYQYAQCDAAGAASCAVFEVGDLCQSSCATCGTACIGSHVIDMSNLDSYIGKKCAILFGSLYLAMLPIINESALHAAFSELTIIRGNLVVQDNPTLTTLSFLSGLEKVDSIIIEGNPSLVDARLPNLITVDTISADINPQLCSGHYPNATEPADQSNCVKVNAVQLVTVTLGADTTVDQALSALSASLNSGVGLYFENVSRVLLLFVMNKQLTTHSGDR